MKSGAYVVGLWLCALPAQAAADVFYCPWAGNVIRLELSEARDRVGLEAASGNFEGSPPIPTILTSKRVGSGEIDVVEFSARDAGYHNIFQLEFWQYGVMLNNVRMNPSDDRVWRDRGYCLRGRGE